MITVRRLFGWLGPAPRSGDDIEAAQEAARLRAENETIRLSQTRGAGSAGQNYQSGRGSGR